MKALSESSIAKFSLGLLLLMAGGLVTGTAYLVTQGNAAEETKRRVGALEDRASAIEEIKVDVAVIKSRLESIDGKLDRSGHRRGSRTSE